MGNYDINFDHDNGHLVNLGGRAFIASATPWFFTVGIFHFLQPYCVTSNNHSDAALRPRHLEQKLDLSHGELALCHSLGTDHPTA